MAVPPSEPAPAGRLQQALLELSRLDALYAGEVEEALRSITGHAARALGVERVNVWRFDEGLDAISCLHSYDREEGHSGGGERLTADECPTYFEAIRDARRIAVGDISEDPRTAELEEYAETRGIDALLDAPVVVEGELWGVLCHEHCGGPRDWTGQEQQIAASVADFVGRAVEARRRREIQERLRDRTAFLRELVTSSPGIIFRLNAGDLSPTYVSPNWEEATGHPPEALLGDPESWVEHIHPHERESVMEAIRQGLSGEVDTITQEYRLLHADGEYRCYHARATVEREDGEPVGIVGHALDITARKRAEETLRASERRFRSLFEENVAGTFQSTMEGELLRVNESFAEIFGYDEPEEVLSASAWTLFEHPEDRLSLLEALEADGRAVNFEFRSRQKDGTPLWLLENSVLMEDPEREGPAIVGTLLDITDRKRLERQLARMAFRDPLTGAANRRRLEERAEQALSLARREDERLAMLYLDLVRFKQVNDTLGHDAGDEVLVEVARRLQDRTRESDTVARVGGDEFAVFLSRVDSAGGARQVAEELAGILSEPLEIRGRELTMRARIGIALFPEHGQTFDRLLTAADRAMYRASDAIAPGAVAVYEPHSGLELDDTLAQEEALRRALDQDEFVLYFQPIYSVADRELAGLEGLLRWQHPERGLLSPAAFIPLAERLGVMSRLDLRAAREALEELKRWSGPEVPWIATNVSADTLHDPDAVDRLAGLLQDSGVEPGRLVLEVTERAAIRERPEGEEALRSLRELGAAISIDDFGTGHSALVYLERFPADYLKMDGAFLRGLGPDSEQGSVAEAIIRMGEGLGLEVIAEWVEEADQREWLERVGCHQMQGFALCEPRPSVEEARGAVPDR